MPTLFIGGSASYIGEATVGQGFVFTASGRISFTSQPTKQYSKSSSGSINFTATSVFHFFGSISTRTAVGPITFIGTSTKFKFRNQIASTSGLIFTGSTTIKTKGTKVAVGNINFSLIKASVNRRKVFVSTGSLSFSALASFQRSVRSNVWIIKDNAITNSNQGASSIWEAAALVDAFTTIPTVITGSSSNIGSTNIWGKP